VNRAEITYPKEVAQGESVRKLIGRLDHKGNIRENLEKFSSFNNRYYQSETGNQSAEWLMAQVFKYVPQFTWVFVTEWTTHGFHQSSITAQIPGKSNKTIVIGAHQYSINVARDADPMTARGLGAGLSYAIVLNELFADYAR
jgi:leucyl aminopeptidase